MLSAKKPSAPLTRQELEEVAEHVCYEVKTLIHAGQLRAYVQQQLKTCVPGNHDFFAGLENCTLESFLLHYRALREFLNDVPKKFPDDVKACDYLPGWKTSESWLSDKNEGSRLHKTLAHICKLRVPLRSPSEWMITTMEEQACRTFKDFSDRLSAKDQQLFAKATEAINHRVTGSMLTSSSTKSGASPTLSIPPSWK